MEYYDLPDRSRPSDNNSSIHSDQSNACGPDGGGDDDVDFNICICNMYLVDLDAFLFLLQTTRCHSSSSFSSFQMALKCQLHPRPDTGLIRLITFPSAMCFPSLVEALSIFPSSTDYLERAVRSRKWGLLDTIPWEKTMRMTPIQWSCWKGGR